ncbi:hypothetical protein ABEB36_005495 [Hypothenemus hampei]|uniref:Uncharacterized protein n=1 Tax=Hypothenemus hampei TaxID=57062 RepID=A0ABD1EYE3_HYPHA
MVCGGTARDCHEKLHIGPLVLWNSGVFYKKVHGIPKEEMTVEKHVQKELFSLNDSANDFGFPANTKFVTMNKERWSSVPIAYLLSSWFVKQGKRSFAIFPVFKLGRKHVRYNGKFMMSTPEYWRKYFNLEHNRYGKTKERSSDETNKDAH